MDIDDFRNDSRDFRCGCVVVYREQFRWRQWIMVAS